MIAASATSSMSALTAAIASGADDSQPNIVARTSPDNVQATINPSPRPASAGRRLCRATALQMSDGRAPECDLHAEVAGTLFHQVAHDAIQPDGRDREGEEAEREDDRALKPHVPDVVAVQAIEAARGDVRFEAWRE